MFIANFYNYSLLKENCFNTLEEAKKYIENREFFYTEKEYKNIYTDFYTYWKKSKNKWVCYTTFIYHQGTLLHKKKIQRGTITEYPFLEVKILDK